MLNRYRATASVTSSLIGRSRLTACSGSTSCTAALMAGHSVSAGRLLRTTKEIGRLAKMVQSSGVSCCAGT